MIGTSCMTCERYGPLDSEPTCQAFPSGIPIKVFVGAIGHRVSLSGDHGLTWAPAKGFEFMKYERRDDQPLRSLVEMVRKS